MSTSYDIIRRPVITEVGGSQVASDHNDRFPGFDDGRESQSDLSDHERCPAFLRQINHIECISPLYWELIRRFDPSTLPGVAAQHPTSHLLNTYILQT